MSKHYELSRALGIDLTAEPDGAQESINAYVGKHKNDERRFMWMIEKALEGTLDGMEDEYKALAIVAAVGPSPGAEERVQQMVDRRRQRLVDLEDDARFLAALRDMCRHAAFESFARGMDAFFKAGHPAGKRAEK